MKKGLSKKLACLVTLITVTSNTVAFAQDINKDETVYVILDENGNPTEQIVSDWIKGSENLGKFSDKSTLSDIKNVKGEEEPVKNGDELTWEVNSKELYYQGKSNNKLPITVWVDYEFNGKKVNPNEVLGQKGNFKISVNITNNESKTTFIKGEKRTLYLPILTAAEITLSNTKFSNLKVTSGKVMDDGNNSLVTFVTIPGLKESLKIGDLLDDLLDGSTVDLSSSFEITGDTDNFEIPAIMLFVFLIILVCHAIEFAVIPNITEEMQYNLSRSILVDFIFIFLSFISYLWIDDIQAKLENKKSIDNSLDWFWKRV